MTNLEQKFFDTVPVYLRKIAEELKRQNDLAERRIKLDEDKAKTTGYSYTIEV